MRNILSVTILLLLIILSSGCKSANQPASSNNPNASNPTMSPGNPIAQSSPGAAQEAMNQPNAAQQNNPTMNGVTPVDSTGTTISMMAMDFHSALLQADKTRLEPLLADEYKRTRSDGTVVNKAQELASVKKMDDMFSMESKPAQINGDTAIVSGTVTLRPPPEKQGGKAVTFQTTDTFKKVKDKWVVTSSVEKNN
jgi:PBP1b-binding outer membrane lipoprotein LpoB